MVCVDLSIEEAKNKSLELKKIVLDDYQYDLVIFVARGSYSIALILAEGTSPVVEIIASRKANKIKTIISPLLVLIPKRLAVFLREKEAKASFHDKDNERNVQFSRDIWNKYKDSKKILLVDDSVDSGHTIIESKKAIEEFFPEATIKVAALNIMAKSIVPIDYYIYFDVLLKGPWSNDSREHRAYVKEYNRWSENYEKQ